MKVQSFQAMLATYIGNRELEGDDLEERKKLLLKYKFSVIVEGEHSEFDNLDKWLEQNIGESTARVYYGKTDYDYGFQEFFFDDQIKAEALKIVVPNIYTIYPKSNPPGHICKTNGSDEIITYSVSDELAVIFPADEIH